MKKSTWYLVAYMVILISFAFIYNNLGEQQFYHSSIQREPAYIEQQELFKMKLTWYLDNQYRNNEISQFIIKDSMGTVIPLKVKRIAIDKIKHPDNDKLFVTASLELIPITEKIQQETGYQYSVHISFNIINHRIFQTDYWRIDDIQTKKVFASPGTFYKDQIDNLQYPLDSNHGMHGIRFTDNMISEIAAYASATFGQPKPSLDNLGRMFYLSAITITTTGYGDIVPLTNTARFLVALEAFLGIVIIGVFLDSLVREIVSEKNTRKDVN